MAAATKRMRCERGRISWRCASVAPRGDTYPRPPSGEDRAPLHGGATAEGPIRKWLRWGVRLIRSRSPLSLLVRERRATGASPSAPRQEVKNRARWVGRNKRRRALGAGSSRILRHPRTLRRGVEHRRAAAPAAGANELRVGRTAASPARRRARRPNTRERKKQLSTTT